MNVDRFARLRWSHPEGGSVSSYVVLEDGSAHLLDAAPWLGGRRTGVRVPGFDDEGRGPAILLAPVEPGKILCVGRNYRAHAAERGAEVPKEPLLFLKATSSLLDPDGTVLLPASDVSAQVEHEVELAIVVGERLRRASIAEAESAVWGLSVAVDVTARDLQKKDGQWTRAKGMDTFCPVGPVVVRGLDPGARRLRCAVNGELRQEGYASEMIFSVAEILAYASAAMTLEPGDLILTGTPSGVGPLRDGDRLDASIEGLGSLRLGVRAGD